MQLEIKILTIFLNNPYDDSFQCLSNLLTWGEKGGELIFECSQAYSTKFAHYCLVITWNLWNLQSQLWIITRDIQILNEKTHKSKKVSCALDFLALG